MSERLTLAQYRALQGQPHGQAGKAKRDYFGEFLGDLAWLGYSPPQRELLFHPERQWRFDAAWEDIKLAIEYQGIYGTHGAGHQSIKGLMRDYRKWTEASLLGWRLILIDAASVADGTAQRWIEQALRDNIGNTTSQS